jgi:DNA-binding CsgD family transcriptional regulator
VTQVEAVDFVHEFYFSIWAALNPKKLEQYYSKDVIAHSGNNTFGYSEIVKHINNLKKSFTHVVPNFHNIMALENQIVVWVTQNAIAKKGENIVLESMIIYEVVNNKIIKIGFMWSKPFEQVFRGFYNGAVLEETSEGIQHILSRRELECFFYLIHGKTAKQIAQMLKISNRTVEDYLARIRHKLNLETSQDVINYAIKKGFVQIDDHLIKLAKV